MNLYSIIVVSRGSECDIFCPLPPAGELYRQLQEKAKPVGGSRSRYWIAPAKVGNWFYSWLSGQGAEQYEGTVPRLEKKIDDILALLGGAEGGPLPPPPPMEETPDGLDELDPPPAPPDWEDDGLDDLGNS